VSRLLSALDARLGLSPAWRAFLGRPGPAAPSWGHALAGAALGLFALQVVTGVALSLHYSATPASAWASVAWIEAQVPLGSFLRAVHHHGTSALLIVYALLLAHGLATATWRRPREALWLNAVVTFLLIPAFALTGNLLPFDQDAWHGLQVELGVIAAAPLGDSLKAALLGGPDVGQATLSRFHALHTLVLPLISAVHLVLWAFIARGVSHATPGHAAPRAPDVPLRQGLRTLFVTAAAFAALLAAATLFGPTRLDAPADPGAVFPATPEWYFLALNQLNALLGTAGGLVVPPLVVLSFLAAPLLDRAASGRRWVAVTPAALGALVLAGLTARGLLAPTDPDHAKAEQAAREDAAAAREAFLADGLDPAGRSVTRAGLALYREKGCAACHDDDKVAAPRLSGWNTVSRTSAFLKDPDAPRFFKGGPLEGAMMAFGGDAAAREALARYLLHGSGHPDEATTTPAHLAAGRKAFADDGCDTCHNGPEVSPRAKGHVPRPTGPDLRGYASFEWTRALVRDIHDPRLFGGAVEEKHLPKMMPSYPDLSDEELSLLSRWLVRGAPGAR
jgi:ubiquinol-cytochrome c reductase cytochrome b subunit